MRTQGCRDAIDWVEVHCHGLSKDSVSMVKAVSKFVKERAPYLALQTTKSINTIRTINDPIIQGKVLEMVKAVLSEKIDPRTGEKLASNTVGVITTPMVKWMIQYAETGEKPPYEKRGHNPKSDDVTPMLAALDELLSLKFDRRAGGYFVPHSNMVKIKDLRAKLSDSQAAKA